MSDIFLDYYAKLCALSWLKVPQALLVEGTYLFLLAQPINIFTIKYGLFIAS
jgi:hypothetical protein